MIQELKQEIEQKQKKLNEYQDYYKQEISINKREHDRLTERLKEDLKHSQEQYQRELDLKNQTIESIMNTMHKIQRERVDD